MICYCFTSELQSCFAISLHLNRALYIYIYFPYISRYTALWRLCNKNLSSALCEFHHDPTRREQMKDNVSILPVREVCVHERRQRKTKAWMPLEPAWLQFHVTRARHTKALLYTNNGYSYTEMILHCIILYIDLVDWLALAYTRLNRIDRNPYRRQTLRLLLRQQLLRQHLRKNQQRHQRNR